MKQAEEIIIRLSPDESVTESVCKALLSQKKGCEQKGLYQTLKPSLKQEELDAANGDKAFANGEWRSQLGVMLG